MAALPTSACGCLAAGPSHRRTPWGQAPPSPSLAVTALPPSSFPTLKAVRRRRRWGWASACSTSFPRLGRDGWQRRESTASLLSFGAGTGELLGGSGGGADQATGDSSKGLSFLLPFVVAATAVAALANPATFSWWAG
ncbi:hypothetical protein B296_00036744 [Ensete ventricosum]|uniref:Uncharacterized protein n=1 Tax=Ensete ventricosum TaxID=4639 RepID=A0A427A1P6_ENSVE|nr:hypothetical protein B296_00036744 [Ensete ventricosum]